MKKLKLFAALCCVAAAFAACTPDNEPEPQPEPHYNVELFFNLYDTKQIDLDTIKKYDANTRVDTIFMIPDDLAGPGGGFSGGGNDDDYQIA